MTSVFSKIQWSPSHPGCIYYYTSVISFTTGVNFRILRISSSSLGKAYLPALQNLKIARYFPIAEYLY